MFQERGARHCLLTVSKRKEALPRGLINSGKLINRCLTSGGRRSEWVPWSRVINVDACGCIGKTNCFLQDPVSN